jgi:hypothetical protein
MGCTFRFDAEWHRNRSGLVSFGLIEQAHPMAKCPKDRKPSDFFSSNGYRSSAEQQGSLDGLAKLQGCSQRTMREWCKKGLIQEAYLTRGGHWRIRRPLSWATRVFFAKRRKDWPFKNEQGPLVSDSEWAELLMLAMLYQQGLLEDLPVPTRWEEGCDAIPDGFDENGKNARRIQAEIERRLRNQEPFWDWLLIGWTYQWVNHCSQENPPCPTVTQMAKFMGLTRPTFYRRYPDAEHDVANAFVLAGGRLKEQLPDTQGFDPVQRANRQAKKPSFSTIQNDYGPAGELRIPRTC